MREIVAFPQSVVTPFYTLCVHLHDPIQPLALLRTARSNDRSHNSDEPDGVPLTLYRNFNSSRLHWEDSELTGLQFLAPVFQPAATHNGAGQSTARKSLVLSLQGCLCPLLLAPSCELSHNHRPSDLTVSCSSEEDRHASGLNPVHMCAVDVYSCSD